MQLAVVLQRSNSEATQTGGAMALEWQILVGTIAALVLKLIAGGPRSDAVETSDATHRHERSAQLSRDEPDR
jgi:hypothetical protein